MRTFFENRWWAGNSKALPALAPFSKLFGTLIQKRAVFLKAQAEKLPVPIVVVGNITVGGSGKTPILMALAAYFLKQQMTVGIISRGYGRKTGGILEVLVDSKAENVGDEPLLIKKRLPQLAVFVGGNRVMAAKILLEKHPKTALILSDDGLQHYTLPRNFELAVFDARGIGNGFLLPRGPLREPLERLKNVDAILLNNFSDKSFLGEIKTPIFESMIKIGTPYSLKNPSLKKSDFGNETRIAAMSAIGNPMRFFESLKKLGFKIAYQKTFPDHHFFSLDDFDGINLPIFITEKDAVKCQTLPLKNAWVLPIEAQIPPVLMQKILEKVKNGTARL